MASISRTSLAVFDGLRTVSLWGSTTLAQEVMIQPALRSWGPGMPRHPQRPTNNAVVSGTCRWGWGFNAWSPGQ
eukprot:6319487-Amphidinium_carterae.1